MNNRNEFNGNCDAKCETPKATPSDGILYGIDRVNNTLAALSDNIYRLRGNLDSVLTVDDSKTGICETEVFDTSEKSPIYIALLGIDDRCAELDKVVQVLCERVNI